MRNRVATLAVGLLLLTACGDDGAPEESPTPATESPTEATESPTEATETPPAATGAVVETADSDLGTILTDAEGRTLYVFLADTGSESTCYDECAENWPAFTTEGDPQAEGDADASLLATSPRTDGAVQVTYNGRPLYYFAADEAPGDTNGQGVGDVWFVASPEGEPIQ